ncbi:hypothetical protein [Brumimicrobium aurantiacum]|uniref:Uncharacterized protein n=1 Tax=Brumimicrobium aurantiacum TaxID=1737063 RepID=A0A3E1EZA1_9FLAO|nr:hypothetical protein [Brumimicrobium aurantiacum]RFC54876.1 hypothetical protein DXU93_03380 [Brumimicrobium aurantiacum]
MKEIKQYLKHKEEEIAKKLISLSFTGLFGAFFSIEKKDEIKQKETIAKKEYSKIKELLQSLEENTNSTSTEGIRSTYIHLAHLLSKEIERKKSTIDVQENELFARLRASQLEFAHQQLKQSMNTYESKQYL